MQQGKIVVIGSINMDLVCRTTTMPLPGQTVMGSDLATIPGGKGANQAVAAARLGGDVSMIGRVGADDFGQRLLLGLQQHGVDTNRVILTEGQSSGCAMILVDARGENAIVVAPGANHRLSPRDIDAAEALIESAKCVVLQLEIPHETVEHALALCRRKGVFTILDPAPAPADGLSATMYGVNVLTPNQSEAESLLNIPASRPSHSRILDPKQLGIDLLARGPQSIVLKLGADGAMILHEGELQRIEPFAIKVVDTTAAGDAFTGALAVGLAEGRPLPAAVLFANAAGALACTRFGAQPSLPSRQEVETLIQSR